MKRTLGFTLIVALFLLTACKTNQTPTPLPTVVLQDNASAAAQGPASSAGAQSSGVSASGILVSDHYADLAFLQSGNLLTINTTVGNQVKKGDILAELDNTLLQLQLDQANLALTELTSATALSSAQKAVAEDQSALNRAQGTYYWWLATNANEALIDKAKADLTVAQDALKDAEEDYNKISGDAHTDKDKAVAYQKLYEAQIRVKEAKANVDMYEDVDPYQLAIYEADVEVAKAKLADDQTLLAALTGEELPENPSGEGYAQLAQARINVDLAQTNIENSLLIAPINGTVAAINCTVGEFVPAGQVQMVLVDPLHLHVETTDLSERDVPEVKVGQNVEVNIKPLNQNTTGKVVAVSPQADSLGGDVIYMAVIRLDSLPEGALPGMSVTVNFLN